MNTLSIRIVFGYIVLLSVASKCDFNRYPNKGGTDQQLLNPGADHRQSMKRMLQIFDTMVVMGERIMEWVLSVLTSFLFWQCFLMR